MSTSLVSAAPKQANPLFDEKVAAEILGTTPGTLQVWRCKRSMPLPYVKIGRSVRYKMSDLQAFIESRTVGGINQ